MQYKIREDREIRNRVKKTRPYESRHTIKCRYDVNNVVKKFANGLGSYGDTKTATSYTPKFTSAARTDKELIDKYYIQSHYPPRDVLTELGSLSGGTWGKVKGTVLGLGAGILVGLAMEHVFSDSLEHPILKVIASPASASIASLGIYWFVK